MENKKENTKVLECKNHSCGFQFFNECTHKCVIDKTMKCLTKK